jgi:uncharacterized protein (DUF1330 family)
LGKQERKEKKRKKSSTRAVADLTFQFTTAYTINARGRNMKALMIATAHVKEPGKFQQYLVKTKEVAAEYGGELMLRSKAERVLTNHEQDHELIVVVRFPSLKKVHQWFDSREYQQLVPLRDEAADMKMTSYELSSQ